MATEDERIIDLNTINAEDHVKLLMENGYDEARARFVVAVSTGEISGDLIELSESDDE